ncbi:metalloregulatory protein (zinc-responsiveness transcriptional activator) [Colletotrichum truncatum]|uniref:Metalloregulatory protein (Zinc-responsiveness transcriptional activator) n=1 Tax=Colletotrichum truncatum TaxID=5467 RepID=A0ACC3Z415_COLTU|nr:metalloregulatory protein (zinc-responsiveness transcriptional activator) [Colletotrichum truncatum]KAF6795669.1 metalloregulatory protein (zinc-responsiveness transcriptional activator) [Colletotrichum truncatum]
MDDQNDEFANLDAHGHDFGMPNMSYFGDPTFIGSEHLYSLTVPHDAHDDSCLDQKYNLHCMASAKSHQGASSHPHVRSMSIAGLPMRQSNMSMPQTPAYSNFNYSHPFSFDTLGHDATLSPDVDFSSMINTKSSPAINDDDTTSVACSSHCEECPSQCGASEAGDVCHDAECGPVCDDTECENAATPCTDIDCLARSMDATDKAAAGVLASFPMGQHHMPHSPLETMPSSQLYSTQTPFHNGGMSAGMGTQSLTMDNAFACQDFLSSSYMDMSMDLGSNDWLALSNHLLQQHVPGHPGSGCVRPCLIDNFDDLNLPFDKCPLPHHSHTHPGQESFCTGQDLHPAECGVELTTPTAWIEHLQEQHPCLPMQHTTNQLVLPQTAPSSMVHHEHQSFVKPKPVGKILVTKDASPDTPSPTSTSSKTEISAVSSMTSVADKIEACVCKWATDGEVCGQEFKDDEMLQQHVREGHLHQLVKETNENGHAGFKCLWDGCTRKENFTQRSKLERHLQTHTGFKPVRCTLCGVALSAKQSLAQHMRIHTGEKPWKCEYPGCAQAFKQQSALTMHMRTHTGEKPLECDICHKRFGESSNLSKHRKTHNVKGQFTCPICNKDFHRLDQQRRHMKVHEKEKNKNGGDNISVSMSPDSGAVQHIRKADHSRVTKPGKK